ncbi:predicted protein [Candida tropicalis MYA-3404]|uniref:Uncharacterized protein n=1 Tax=Candida tropicalis (strain ATCC MYA-3404 / T1) TaxID=294747 RepID=C5MHY5_CANTT|nr:predicted protein [Candida tropicalis MYA-3404]EER30682.1 predicted protein [Candida tropicalis MYA-3404]KAG4409250.1 hypothetical protein JTP64_002556 [Candida tropicalis]
MKLLSSARHIHIIPDDINHHEFKKKGHTNTFPFKNYTILAICNWFPIFIHEHGLKQYHVGTFNFLSSIESNSNIDDIFTSSAFFLYCYLFFKQTNNPCFFFFYYNQRNTKNYETIEITNIRSKMFGLIISVIYTTHVSLINV